jgi:hypothetical protein
MKLDESLADRVESCMEERWVETGINGDGGELIGRNTGLPQGPPASPILFLIYIADLQKQSEKCPWPLFH